MTERDDDWGKGRPAAEPGGAGGRRAGVIVDLEEYRRRAAARCGFRRIEPEIGEEEEAENEALIAAEREERRPVGEAWERMLPPEPEKVEEEEGEPPQPFFRRPGVRKALALLAALALFAQAAALFPQMFSLAAIRFLVVSAQLSQSPDIQAYKKSVVVIRSGNVKGTGFIVSENGLVVTNRHVVDDAGTLFVHLPDGGVYRGEIAALDEAADLALVRIAAEGLPALRLAESYDGSPNVPVYIIGNPLFFNGIANEGQTIGMAGAGAYRVLLIDAPVYRGNSGSPVLTHDGEVLGVVYAVGDVPQEDGGRRKAGFAVPVDRVHALLAKGKS